MEQNNFFASRKFAKIVTILIVLGLIFGAFRLGELVGSKKAAFSFRWGENYYRNFAGPGPKMFDLDGRDFISAHGVAGKIVEISTSSIVLADRENLERIVITDNNTEVLRFRDKISLSDLVLGDEVAIIGSPENSGKIVAKLIRVLPPAPGFEKLPRL